jgi:molybdate transport system substrate-binding protein
MNHASGSRLRPVFVLLLLGAWTAMLAQCKQAPATPPPPTAAKDQLVIFAAASLRDAFGQLADQFEQTHPQLELTFNFAGSQELRTQIEQGAGADVFASADARQMAELQHAALVGKSAIFARNELVMVVAREQAGTLKTLADLPSAGKLVMGGPDVPIGRYTLQLLDNAARTLGADFRQRVLARVVSQELNVKQVLAKVSLGEADAGIVYRTDVTAADSGKVSVVTIAPEQNVIAEYPIAVIASTGHAVLASAFQQLVLSPDGQRVLKRAGFSAP